MTHDDVPAALQLCRVAGWNQLESDWMRLIKYEPRGCFAAVIGHRLVGTVTSTSYGNDLAWIGMMLVDEAYRRRGIASDLMNTCVDYLVQRKVRCIKLDATPLGEPVYKKLGFQIEWSFHRWSIDKKMLEIDHIEPDNEPASVVDHSSIMQRHQDKRHQDKRHQDNGPHADLDRGAFGVDRSIWLRKLSSDSYTVSEEHGFGMLRRGYLANYLGPVVAKDPSAARRIVDDLLRRADKGVFWDIPHPNHDAVQLAKSLQFQPVRDLTRMWMGDASIPCQLKYQYALSDPATG